MKDNIKQNIFFALSILFFLLGIHPSRMQILFGFLGCCSVISFLYYLSKIRLKIILDFFRRH